MVRHLRIVFTAMVAVLVTPQTGLAKTVPSQLISKSAGQRRVPGAQDIPSHPSPKTSNIRQ